MDKNFSVDDILQDIKSKKMQRKDGVSQPPEQAQLADQFPGKEPRGRNGVAFMPDTTMRETPAQLFPFRGKEPSPPRQSIERQAGAPPQRPYSLEADEDVFEAGLEGDTSVFEVPRDAPESPRRRINDDNDKPRRSPLDFDGRVRSITDRIKLRKNKGDARPELPGESTSVLDFDKLHTPGPNHEDTQPFPGLGPSRELDLEEIKNIDFADGAEEGYRYHDFEGEDEDDYQEEGVPRPVVDFSEYNSIEDRREVAIDIARTKLWLVIRTAATAVLTAILIYLVLCARFPWPMPVILAPENDLGSYLIALTVLGVGVALVGSSAMGGGLISLFKMRANSDSLAALAMLGAVGQGVFAILRPENVNVEALTLYGALAATAMLFNALGKLSMISRIQKNFKIIASDRPKRAVLLAEDENFTREYLKGATRRPTIAYAARCEFFTDFLALSYSDKYDVGINRAVAPVCLLGAGVVGALTYILTQGGAMTALTAMVGILCVSATLSATFIENVPLSKMTKKLAPRGGMVSGNKAVEDFCDISGIVLDEKDLFPAGHAQILGMKTYSQGRVDEAILDAASLAYALNSCLGSVFLQMIGGNKKLLRKVDNPSFEDGRGITAWIDGRRVLLGGRAMLMSNGIELPAPGYEKQYPDGEPLFLASSGELIAQLVVGYTIDEELALELDKFAALGKLLIVRTVDASLTPHKIWELYGYPENLIQIMPAHQHEQYEKMSAPRPSELAEVAYTGRASAMVGSILACGAARSSILAATVFQLIQIALGYGMITLMAFMGSIDTLTILLLGGYQLFWFVVIGIVQRMKAA
ncbi:MAG: hypothetical protein FWE19_04335 [Oscillospiraceae bacterium]|nr:hypothetical protein [Oscillospiraceae bacterium]